MIGTTRLVAGLAGAAAALAAGAVVVAGRDDPPPPPALQPLVDAVVRAGAPGIVAYVRDERGVRRAAAGVAEIAGRRPMTVDARFRAASVTKTFVAAVVLQLVAELRLTLDDPVERWLPGLLPDGREITIRQLLRHRSGLIDHLDDPAVLAGLRRDPQRTWSARELVRRTTERAGRPGADYEYSSTNYLALGLIVEAVTGRPLAHELRRRILAPLRLRDTAYVPGAPIPGPHAHGYAAAVHDGLVGGRPVDTSRHSASWAGAAGAIVSDADDLARFFDALLGGRLLPPDLTAAMHRPLAGRRRGYGLGLVAYTFACGTAWGHTGNLLGYITAAYSTPDRSRQIVMMVNSFPLPAAAHRAFRRALERAFCD